MTTCRELQDRLRALANPDTAAHSARFFKTGPGEYGEGDRFLGIRVPVLRKQARSSLDMAPQQVGRLLESAYHEERLCAVLILVGQYAKATPADRERIYAHYLANTRYINNWDLVDSSAHLIVGRHLQVTDRQPLYRLAESASLWERRIAIIATLHYIRQDDFDDTLAIAERLLDDGEDLIHKAVGWMLREIGNRDADRECRFLDQHCRSMPRTMLRYAIEKFSPEVRRAYLDGKPLGPGS